MYLHNIHPLQFVQFRRFMWNVLFPVIHHDSFSTNDVHLLFPFCFCGFLFNFYSVVPDAVRIISFTVYRRAARYNQSSTDGWWEQNRVSALLKPPPNIFQNQCFSILLPINSVNSESLTWALMHLVICKVTSCNVIQ